MNRHIAVVTLLVCALVSCDTGVAADPMVVIYSSGSTSARVPMNWQLLMSSPCSSAAVL